MSHHRTGEKSGNDIFPQRPLRGHSNPFYDVDTEKYSRQITEKANEKKRATADGNTGKTANGTSTVASSTVAKADFSGVVRERWEKVHLSSEDERAKGSADVSIVRLNENAFKMKMKLNCPSILNEQDALIHWGIIGPHDEDWKSQKLLYEACRRTGESRTRSRRSRSFRTGEIHLSTCLSFRTGIVEKVAMLIRGQDYRRG